MFLVSSAFLDLGPICLYVHPVCTAGLQPICPPSDQTPRKKPSPPAQQAKETHVCMSARCWIQCLHPDTYWLHSIACTITSQPPHGQGCPGLSRGAGRDARKVAGMGMWHYKHFVLGYTSSYPWSTESYSGVLSPGGTWAWWRETSEGPQKR